jgi:hypothetical protein
MTGAAEPEPTKCARSIGGECLATEVDVAARPAVACRAVY